MPECPICRKDINHLEHYILEPTHTSIISLEDGGAVTCYEDSLQGLRMSLIKCPECGRILFIDGNDAIEFLKNGMKTIGDILEGFIKYLEESKKLEITLAELSLLLEYEFKDTMIQLSEYLSKIDPKTFYRYVMDGDDYTSHYIEASIRIDGVEFIVGRIDCGIIYNNAINRRFKEMEKYISEKLSKILRRSFIINNLRPLFETIF